MLCLIAVALKLTKIEKNLLPPNLHYNPDFDDRFSRSSRTSMHSSGRRKNAEEEGEELGEKLILPDGHQNTLPPFLSLPLKRRSKIGRWILGHAPSRHELLFWCDRKGPKLIVTILQTILLLTAIYLSVFGFHFAVFTFQT